MGDGYLSSYVSGKLDFLDGLRWAGVRSVGVFGLVLVMRVDLVALGSLPLSIDDGDLRFESLN